MTNGTRNGGDFSEDTETITIVFDAEHKVSIQLGISAGVLETNQFPDMKASRLIFTLLLASSVAVVQLAAQQTKADQRPLKEVRAKAEAGDAESQAELGLRYEQGKGVAKDQVEAVKWVRKGAEQNVAEAQYNLGVCLYSGKGLAKDQVESVKWFRKAAEQNYAKSRHRFGATSLYSAIGKPAFNCLMRSSVVSAILVQRSTGAAEPPRNWSAANAASASRKASHARWLCFSFRLLSASGSFAISAAYALLSSASALWKSFAACRFISA